MQQMPGTVPLGVGDITVNKIDQKSLPALLDKQGDKKNRSGDDKHHDEMKMDSIEEKSTPPTSGTLSNFCLSVCSPPHLLQNAVGLGEL